MENSHNIEIDNDEENMDSLQHCTMSSEDSEDIARSIVESEEWPSYIEQLRKAGDEDDDLACKPSSSGRYVTWGTRKLPLVSEGLIREAGNDDFKFTDTLPVAELLVGETNKELIKGARSTSASFAAVDSAEERVSPLQLPKTKPTSPPVYKTVPRCFTRSFPDCPDECSSSPCPNAASPLKSGHHKATPWGTPSEGCAVQSSGSKRLQKRVFRSPYKQSPQVPPECSALRRSLALLSLSEHSEPQLSNDKHSSSVLSPCENNVRDGATGGPRTPGTSSSVFSPFKQANGACTDVTGSKSPFYAKSLEWSKDIEQFRAALGSSGSSGDCDLVKSSFRISKSGSSFMALERFFIVDNVNIPGTTTTERLPAPRLSLSSSKPSLMKPSAASRVGNGEQSPPGESSSKNLLLKRLGRGAFGCVFGVQIKGRLVAVKDVRNVDDPAERNAMHLVHRHVVRTLYITQLEPRRFLVVMEYGGPKTLQNMLNEGRLQLLDTIRYGRQIAAALHYCHRCNILHLDVKPSNILMRERECKLADFGSSAVRGTKPKVCGTVQYMAPEALCGQRPDYACDIYSLGIVLWQMHSGQRPFDGLHQHAIIFQVVREKKRPPFPDDAPADFQELVNRCWTTSDLDRPTTSTVVKDLNALHKAILLVRNAAS